MDDLNKERIRFNIETVKLLTLLFITTGGGAMALILGQVQSIAEKIFGFGGLLFAAVSGAGGIIIYRNTLKKLRQ